MIRSFGDSESARSFQAKYGIHNTPQKKIDVEGEIPKDWQDQMDAAQMGAFIEQRLHGGKEHNAKRRDFLADSPELAYALDLRSTD